MAFPSSADWRSIAWNGTVFCAISSGTSDKAATATDGLTWVARTLPAVADWRSIAWNGTVFCAVAWGGTVAATSPDGITWTARTLPSSSSWSAITWNGTVFCAVAWGGTAAATSPDGITWTARTLPSSLNWVDVAWNGTVFCAIANGSSTCATSPDGTTWSSRSIGYSTSWRAIAAGTSGFVAIASGTDAARHSADGITWYARYMPSVADWWDLAWDGANFTAVAYASAKAATLSPNAMTTTARTLPASLSWYGVAWNGTIFCAIAGGTLSATSADGIAWITEVPVPPPTGTATAPTALTVVGPTGTATAPTALTVVGPTGTATAPTALTVVGPTGTATAPTALTVVSTGSASAPSLLAMIAPAPAVPGVPGVVWSGRCLIDGVDVSAQLVGQASVTAAEGAARIASVTLRPPAGIVAPLDYVGKPITLDYVLMVAGTPVPRRLFTGRVDTPAYDPDSSLLTLTCTDDLQNIIAALPRSTVIRLTGGLFTEAVQGEMDDEWDYAQARLTTVAGSLDASASGGLRTTLWDSGSTWATFTESELIYQRMQLTLPQRSTLVNKVEIAFDYRYTRLRQRQTTVGWSGTEKEMQDDEGMQFVMKRNGFQYPTQQDILGAAEGTGWTVTRGIFSPAPAAIEVEFVVGPSLLMGFFHPPAGSVEMAVLHLAHRHSQTVTERYSITVTADASVAVNGELPSALRGAIASDFSGSAWESALDVVPLMPGGGTLDYAPDADRADADYAIQTLLDQARVKILSSHRSGRVGNAILCNPDLDLDKRVAIDTAKVSASGKVANVVHVLDFAEGSAITEFSLAIFGAAGTGGGASDPLEPPPRPAFVDHSMDWLYEIPPLGCHTYGTTPYDEGLMGLLLNPTTGIRLEDTTYFGQTINTANPFYVDGSYPVTGFRMQMPGVDDADRNPIDDTISASYSITVPTDALTFTVP
jgi:hypothetical protein